MSAPTVGGLFAGYGGYELAIREVWPDARPAWFCQHEPPAKPGGKPPRQAASMILEHHWPGVPNHGDVTAVDWSAVEPVDILAGGSPCQDVSHAGKRRGMKAGTRSGLWASMCDAIDTIRPSLVLWENVRGALSAEADSAVEPCPFCVGDDPGVTLRALGRVLGDLAELGYDAGWYGLRASDVGAPHGRFRVFVAAWPAADAGSIRLDGWARVGGTRRDAAEWGQARDHAGDRTAPPAWGSREWRDLTLLPTPAVNDMGAAYTPDEWDAWTERMKAAHGNGNGHGASLHIEALRLLPSPRTSDTNGAGVHGDGGMDLRTAVSLLPTPKATNNENRQSLDRYGMNLGMALDELRGETDARAAEGRPAEDLRGVRGADGPAPLREATRGPDALPGPEVLLAELREHQADGDEGRPALAGAEAQGRDVRGVRNDRAPARSPRRPESGEQRTREPRDAVRVVSPAAPLAGGQGEADGCCARFGQYAPAVHRWEQVLGRPAPAPTEPTGKDGAHRLSARFVEFLMGLPEGHVTAVPGITRNDMLKALGNGIVPQQAAAAIRHLLAMRAATKEVAA